MIYYKFNLSNQKEINQIISYLSKLSKEGVITTNNESYSFGRHIRFYNNGLLEFDDGYNSQKIEEILRDLYLKNLYYCKGTEYSIKSLYYPLKGITKVQINNLKNIIYSKQNLIKRAFRSNTTEILIDKDKIIFPWFIGSISNEEINAYKLFIKKLVIKACNTKFTKIHQYNIINEKYEFKNFIYNLDLGGKRYKKTREILTQYLIGDSSYLFGRKLKGENKNEIN